MGTLETCPTLGVRRQFAGKLLVLDVPNADFAREVADEDSFAIMAEDDARRDVAETLELDELAAVGFPEPGGVVSADGGEQAVSGILDGQDTERFAARSGRARGAVAGRGVDRACRKTV